MERSLWCETYAHLFYHLSYKNQMIYHDRLDYGREKGWSDTYIHFSQRHQQFLHYLRRKSGWYLQTYFHVLQFHPYYLPSGSNSVWSGTYIQISHHHQYYLLKSQQSTTFTLVRGGIVTDRIPISKSPFHINSCYPISRERLADILWPRAISINVSSAIKRVIVSVNN